MKNQILGILMCTLLTAVGVSCAKAGRAYSSSEVDQTFYSRPRPPIEAQWSPASYYEVRRGDTDATPDDHKDLPEYLDHPPPGWEHDEHDDEPPSTDDIAVWTTTTTTETPAPMPPRRRFTKLLGKKLTTIPLIFSLWFITYCIFLMLRAAARRKVNLPNKYKARTLNDVLTNSEKWEALNEMTRLVMTMVDNFKRSRK